MAHPTGKMNILHHSLDGYVATCDCCNRLQVAFGTAVMNLDEPVLRALMDKLECDRDQYQDQVDPRIKVFPYDLLCGNVHMILNYGEIIKLHTMLSDALWIRHVYERVAVAEL